MVILALSNTHAPEPLMLLHTTVQYSQIRQPTTVVLPHINYKYNKFHYVVSKTHKYISLVTVSFS